MASQVLAEEFTRNPEVEYNVKAAFIYNFTKFIDWPPEAFEGESSSFRIGILGTGPIDHPLMNLSGEKVRNRLLEVSKVQNLNEVSRYHVIFVNPSENGNVRSILNALRGTGILTIGDMSGFTEQCGIINFYLKNGKIRFEINVEATRQANLHVSPGLLRLARIVNSQCD